MREIELKFKVDNLQSVIDFLISNDCSISEDIVQNDTIFVNDLNNVESVKDSVWLRIRQLNDKIELNYKKQSEKLSESKEIEFEVSSAKQASSFLKALDFKEWVKVNKIRKYSKFNGCTICIDTVERLGSFVELEILVDENDTKDYEEYLLKTAITMGINPQSRISGHYDTMINNLDKI